MSTVLCKQSAQCYLRIHWAFKDSVIDVIFTDLIRNNERQFHAPWMQLERFIFHTNGKHLRVSDFSRCHPFMVKGQKKKYFRTMFAEDRRRQEWNTKESMFWQRFESVSNAYLTNAPMKQRMLPIFNLRHELKEILDMMMFDYLTYNSS